MLASATNELKFHQWPTEAGDEPYSLNVSTKDIVSLSWSKDNNFLIYLQEGGRPEILSLKDVNNIKPIHIVTAIDKATAAIFQRKTKRCVAIGTESATIALYDTKTKSIAKLFTLPAAVISLDFNASDELLAVACCNGYIVLFNVNDGTEAITYSINEIPSIVRFHHKDECVFALGTNDGRLYAFNTQLPDPLFECCSHSTKVNGLVFCIKQNSIVTIGDNKFCVHDIEQTTCIYRGHLQYPLTSIDITPEGKYIAVGTSVGQIVMYDTVNFLTPWKIWHPHETKICVLKFSNKTLDTGSNSDNSNIVEEHAEGSSHVREENEFKSLYDKFISSSEDETVELLKDDIIGDMAKSAAVLRGQMTLHMVNFEEFIRKEFEKMAMQMDEKWDLLNMVSNSYMTAEKVEQQRYEEELDREDTMVLR